LKLTFNHTAATQEQSYSEEVKSNNNRGYVFENLLFGEKYEVQVTAISTTGQTIPSKMSYINTTPYGMCIIYTII